MNPILLETMAKIRHEELMREAEHLHLIAAADQAVVNKSSKLMVIIGKTLVLAGNKLLERYQGNQAPTIIDSTTSSCSS